MALQKQPLNINFAQGINTKSDPYQIPIGQFLELENSVFQNGVGLQKRNGFLQLASLPNSTNTFLTTYNGNLTAIGTSFNAYSSGSMGWVNKGAYQPCSLSVLPAIRSNLNQSQADSALADNGLRCVVYTDNPASGAVYKYAIIDSVTGQNIVAPTAIPVASGTVTGSPRVFLLGNYFMIVFTNVITATNHLQYVAINSLTPTSVGANTDISATYTPATTVNFDGVVANSNLYLAWNGSDGGGAIRITYIDTTLLQHGTVTFASRVATIMSVSADTTGATPVVYASFYDSGTSTGYTLAVNQNLVTILAPTQIIASGTILNITSSAYSGLCNVFYETSNAYSYDAAIKSNFISHRTITSTGTLGSAAVVIRSLGLASKSFRYNSVNYFLGVYFSSYQPTYFLMNESGKVISKLAYANAGPYYILGLPNVSLNGAEASTPYLRKDLVEATNKTQGGAVSAPVYSQTGINIAMFNLGESNVSTAEIGSDLHLSGGFLWMYDGYVPVEHGFHLWPDSIEITTSGAGGLITAQQYFYQVTYEWADNQGNIFRSAPSIPVAITTTGATSSNTINVPYLRLTYKTANPVKIVIYRWSTAQQTYYQVTSISAPSLNVTTSDSLAFVDTLADSAIIGNNIIYTTGGVIENIAAPASDVITLFKSRLFLVDAEDRNLLWYSKQVIESVPVEMSDLLTLFVAPTIGAQGSTGPITALSAMDDKLIIFKEDAIYYVTGTGPDNTGANNDFSDPVFITSNVGCSNQSSIVFIPQGLMFQSDKGIWLLGRDLSTQYIGAPAERYNSVLIQSALAIAGTNQVRFTLSNNLTLMYDYYYSQWGTFTGIPALSSTLYQGVQAFINSYGQVFQESPGSYLDGTRPVLLSFLTGWLNLGGLQGFERAYFFYLLGTYISPHKLTISIAYDYAPAPSQSVVISPDNYNGAYGADTIYGGGSPYGGNPTLEQWRVFFEQQKCQAFQIQIQESFDSTVGAPAGAGLTISGLDIQVGIKDTKPRLNPARSIG